MGGILTVLAEVIELASVTGLSAESIISGEAFTTAELLQSHIANLVTYGGLTEAEALAATEVTSEAFQALQSLTPNFPQIFGAVAGLDITANSSLLLGAAVAAALYPYNWSYSQPVAMANWPVVLWRPDYDIDFPGMRTLARFINYISPENWGLDLLRAMGEYLHGVLQRERQRQIEYYRRELERRTAQHVRENLARYFENARWAVTNAIQAPVNLYRYLGDYYRALPGPNPVRARQLARALGQEEPYRYDRFETEQDQQTFTPQQKSADYVERYDAPGGASQRTTPDWMLPLILGLYGDISPTWGEFIQKIEEEEEKEDGPKKKKLRRTIRGSKTNNKRRNRSAQRPNRP
ncbi:minor capsid protein VP2 [Myotis horsfieldii polyomavirus 1]|nr:minor capsid protein VP2 [Myotis horsfieldii polyomavirus 1]